MRVELSERRSGIAPGSCFAWFDLIANIMVIGGEGTRERLSWDMPAISQPTQHYALPSRTINVEMEYELQYWSRAFGVGREALLAAVQAVGPSARAVSRQLGKG
jgi:hypothetical protein